jgi:hypothetical protein
VGHRFGFWVTGLRGSAGLHTQVTGSPKTATGTAEHGGPDLWKDRVTQVLPDSSGLARGSRVQAPGFVGFRVLGTTGVDPPVASAENRVTGVPWVPGSAPSLPISDSPSPDLLVSLSLSTSLSLYPSSLSLNLRLSLSLSHCVRARRKKEEERR